MGKVVSQAEIINIVRNGQAEGKTYAATNGCFDILHVGHIRYLQKTKALADFSIVMLNSDKSVKLIKGDDRPINCEADRAEKSPSKLLEAIKPDIYTKGADYTLETLPERDVVIRNNIKVEFIDFVAGKSTTNVINRCLK